MADNIFEQRLEKLEALGELIGIKYPNNFKVDTAITSILEEYKNETRETLETKEKKTFSIAGRVMFRRIMGKAGFLNVRDRDGDLQLYVSKKSIPEDDFTQFKKLLDIGDIIGVKGYPFVTKTGELSLHVTEFKILTKSLSPLPEKFHGLTDIEARYRQRYVDLIMNQDSRARFIARSKIVKELRNFFDSRNYLEVETPMLHPIAGGAAARPFITHHNTLDMELYLRIAPELYLKRLIVGGFERVYEINRNFRNEGISTRHNPEFTMVEFYQAYATYTDLMDMTEEMFKTVAEKVFGKLVFEYQGNKIDFSKPFKRLSVYDGIKQYLPEHPKEIFTDIEVAKKYAKEQGAKIEDYFPLGKVLMELFEHVAEKDLIEPVFITDFPLDVSPLSRKKDSDNSLVDRFELYIGGFEIANAFSELNDPLDQEQRFMKQIEEKEAGDDEAHNMDADYIRALKYGMPPTAGEGIGIDRLVMLLTDAPSIRDVILFPLLKKE